MTNPAYSTMTYTKEPSGVTAASSSPGTILEEAARCTSQDRNEDYGHPRDNIENTAALWNSYLQRRGLFKGFTCMTGHDVAMMMVLVKISRDANKRTRDNLVDIAGWARVAEMLDENEA